MRRAAVALAVLALGPGLAACGGDGDGGDTAGGGGGGGGGGDKARFCELAAQDDIGGLEDFDPTRTEDMEELDRALEELSDAAPGEIQEDVDTLAAGLRELVDIVATVDTSDPDALAELGERAGELEEMQARMQRATERVDAYLEEECGIDPES